MPTATSHGTDSTGIQRRYDWVNAEVNTLNLPVEWHTDLIFEGLESSWFVAMLTGRFFHFRHFPQAYRY